jgi:hypothetical protein
VQVAVLLVVGRGQVQERLHHLLLTLPVLGHGRPELSGTVVEHLHRYVVHTPLVDGCYVLRRVVRHTLVHLHHLRPPHLLSDLPQSGPVFCVQVPQPAQRSIRDLGSLRRRGGLGRQAGHLGHGLFLHAAKLLGVCRGLGGHGFAQGALALAAPHYFGGHELQVGHARFGAARGLPQFDLFELGVTLAFLHFVMGLLNAPELRNLRSVPQGDCPAVREADLVVFFDHVLCVENRGPLSHPSDERFIVAIRGHGFGWSLLVRDRGPNLSFLLS